MMPASIDLRDPELSKRCKNCGEEKREHLVSHPALKTEDVDFGILQNCCPEKMGTRVEPYPKFKE